MKRDDRFMTVQLTAQPMTFAYRHKDVSIFVGQGGVVFASYIRGNEVVVLEIADERFVQAFMSMCKAAIVEGMLCPRGTPRRNGTPLRNCRPNARGRRRKTLDFGPWL